MERLKDLQSKIIKQLDQLNAEEAKNLVLDRASKLDGYLKEAQGIYAKEHLYDLSKWYSDLALWLQQLFQRTYALIDAQTEPNKTMHYRIMGVELEYLATLADEEKVKGRCTSVDSSDSVDVVFARYKNRQSRVMRLVLSAEKVFRKIPDLNMWADIHKETQEFISHYLKDLELKVQTLAEDNRIKVWHALTLDLDFLIMEAEASIGRR